MNSSQGGGSKDTWVLAPPHVAAPAVPPAWERLDELASPVPFSSAEPEPGPRFTASQHQQQQQQQQRPERLARPC